MKQQLGCSFLLVGMTAAAWFSNGCASPSIEPENKIVSREGIPIQKANLAREANPFEPGEEVSLSEAMVLALKRNPELAAFSDEIRAADARVLQAKLWPNPAAGLEVEEFGGTGESGGFNSAEQTYALSQLVPTAGKIKKRVRMAGLRRELAVWDYESKKLDVLTQVLKAFVRVKAGQERLETALKSFDLAEEVYDTISKQVEAGDVSPIEKTRAQVTLSTSRIDLEQARRELEAARQELAASWGSPNAEFTSVTGELDSPEPAATLEELEEFIHLNPQLARWQTELAERRADLQLAQADRFPDVTVQGGLRRLESTGDASALVGISVPIPLFDRNQGRIAEAKANISKAEEQWRAAEIRVRSNLRQAYQRLMAAFEEVKVLNEITLPAAELAFESIRTGFLEGKFPYLNVLDAQRTLFDIRFRYVAALENYYQTWADVQRLVGSPLQELIATPGISPIK